MAKDEWLQRVNSQDDGSYTDVVDGKIVVRSIYDDDDAPKSRVLDSSLVALLSYFGLLIILAFLPSGG